MNDPESGAAVASIDYELDMSSRDKFRKALEPLAGAPIAIVDLANARYIDSTAVTELLLLYKARAEKPIDRTRLVIGSPGGTVARIVELAGLARIYAIYETVEAARA